LQNAQQFAPESPAPWLAPGLHGVGAAMAPRDEIRVRHEGPAQAHQDAHLVIVRRSRKRTRRLPSARNTT
jgi:hypothetical protein